MCYNACVIHTKKGQTMTSVLIENVSPEFLPKFKALAKTAKAEFKRFVAETTKAEKTAKTKDLKKAKPEKKAKVRAKKVQEPEFYELEDMPVMKELEKWRKAHPKEHAQLVKEVRQEMGLI